MHKTTEEQSRYRHLEKMSTSEILRNMNAEDKTVPLAIEKALPQLELLADETADKLLAGGRLFYIGAGTSGRLGIVDASECPPTFGIEQGIVIGLMAGGDSAIRHAVEFAEDNLNGAWEDLKKYNINTRDIVVGIAASGTTPYVVGGLKKCREVNIATGCIVCNLNSPVAAYADFPVEVITGPEFVTGSTRLKSGTAQKLALNMLSTTVMIKLGRVEDNKMVNMQLTNNKLVERGTQMVMQALEIDHQTAQKYLLEEGSVKKAIDRYRK